jgi:ABC-type glycerol-3-phosphate transport system substrate-binding protein
MRWLALLVMALALVAAGCGGSDNESAATTDETTTTETTSGDTTTSEETTSEETTGTSDLGDVLGDEDCLALAGVGATIAQAFSGASGGTASTEELEQLADKVPEEIRADVQTLAAAFATYADKIKDIGITPGSTPNADQVQQLQAAIASLDQDELTAASQRIEAWSKKNCGAAGG